MRSSEKITDSSKSATSNTSQKIDTGEASPGLIIVTGSNSIFFPNLRVLIGSWTSSMHDHSLIVCDFGLSQEQKDELKSFNNIELISINEAITHPWLGKSLIGRFVSKIQDPWNILMWIDADAFFVHRIPNLENQMAGYDMMIDAHVQSVGAIVHECNREALSLNKSDAYFSAGWWIARRGCLLESYERFAHQVAGQGNLWECDAFVAAIYHEKLRIRTLCGGIWHSRGATSLRTSLVTGLSVFHENHPVYVVHTNAEYTMRNDGRRILNRADLSAIQDHYEKIYNDKITG